MTCKQGYDSAPPAVVADIVGGGGVEIASLTGNINIGKNGTARGITV